MWRHVLPLTGCRRRCSERHVSWHTAYLKFCACIRRMSTGGSRDEENEFAYLFEGDSEDDDDDDDDDNSTATPSTRTRRTAPSNHSEANLHSEPPPEAERPQAAPQEKTGIRTWMASRTCSPKRRSSARTGALSRTRFYELIARTRRNPEEVVPKATCSCSRSTASAER